MIRKKAHTHTHTHTDTQVHAVEIDLNNDIDKRKTTKNNNVMNALKCQNPR